MTFRPLKHGSKVLRSAFLGLVFAVGPYAALSTVAAPPREIPVADAVASAAAEEIAQNVSGIARSGAARAKKEKLISEAMRTAVLEAAGRVSGEEAIVRMVVELTTAAVQAAPAFSEVIAQTASFAGPVAAIKSARTKIRSAAFTAAERASPSAENGYLSPAASGGFPGTSVSGATVRYTRTGGGDSGPVDSPANSGGGSGDSKIQMGKNSTVTFTGGLSVTHQSNFGLRNTDETAETITAVKPGVDFVFGQKSLARGSVGYAVSFTKYAKIRDADGTLGTGHADFGYANGRSKIAANASYRESDQGTRDTVGIAPGQGRLTTLRSNQLSIGTGGETAISAKTGVTAGVNFDLTKYKTPGLAGSRNISVPVRVLLDLTPKLAATAGYTYGRAQAGNVAPANPAAGPAPQRPRSQDSFFNVGLRGALTGKLSSNFSVGYRTRKIGDQVDAQNKPADDSTESSLGFDGSFSLSVAAKTNLSLSASRNFSVSAAGESLENSSYSLSVASDPTLQWKLAGGVSYRGVDYGSGARTFLGNSAPALNAGRFDNYWEFSASASYVITSWMNTSVSLSRQQNGTNLAPRPSTESPAYANTILSLMLGFQY